MRPVYIGPVMTNSPSVIARDATLAPRAARRRGRSTACRCGRRVQSRTRWPTPASIIVATAARIADRRDRDVVEFLLQDLGDDRHHVLRAAGAAIVAMVDQQHRRARIGEAERLGARHRFGQRRRDGTRTRRAAPTPSSSMWSQTACACVAAAVARVADHDGGHAGVRRVGMRERRQQRRGEHRAVGFHAPREARGCRRTGRPRARGA